MPFLPGSLYKKTSLEYDSKPQISSLALTSWLKLVDKRDEGVKSENLLNAIRETFKADTAILFGLSEINETPSFCVVVKQGQNKQQITQDKNKTLSQIKSWFKKEKRESLILYKDDSFPQELYSIINSIGYENSINFLFYLLPSSIDLDKKFGLMLFSPQSRWDERHLNLLEAVKSELGQMVHYIQSKNVQNGEMKKPVLKTKDSAHLIQNNKKYLSKLNEPDAEKVLRLESELKLTLEEYDRVHKLLEENIKKSSANWK